MRLASMLAGATLAFTVTFTLASTAAAQEAPPPEGFPGGYDPEPSKGTGMIIGGAILTGIGGLNLLTAPLCTVDDLIPNADVQRGCVIGSLVVGGVGLAVGLPLLIVGVGQRSDYRDWEARHPYAGWLKDIRVDASPGGASLGWSTSF
ncbi:MAG: hypothetical protein KC731_32760 [Myxococcales bacterium]|nr:hypothetical protein [Myxococcales bacterium]